MADNKPDAEQPQAGQETATGEDLGEAGRALYRGRPLAELTRRELIDALVEMGRLLEQSREQEADLSDMIDLSGR